MLKKPLKKIRQADGSVSLENLMRMHRFVSQRDSKRYVLETKEHWPKDKLPKFEFYSREFIEVMVNDEDNILERLELSKDAADAIRRRAWFLEKTQLRMSDAEGMIRTMKWALKNHPLSKRLEGKNEFEEETRTRNEIIADAFLDMNKKRFSAPPGSKEPFPDKLLAAIIDPDFLDASGVTQEVKDNLLALKKKEFSAMNAREKDFVSNSVGRALYNCPLVKERIGHLGENSPKRRYVSPQSSMREIKKELNIEAGEIFEDRRPDKGEKRGQKGTMYSEDLLRTIFNEEILRKLGFVAPGEPVDPNAEEFAFLRSEYRLENPITDHDGNSYPSVENAYNALRTKDPDLRKRIAEADPKESWKLVSDLPKPDSLHQGRQALTKMKFRNNPDLMEKLLQTGSREITGPGGITLMKIRDTELKSRGGNVGNHSWIFSWKKQVDLHPEEGSLAEYLSTLNEKQKDSLHMCVGSTIKGAFRRYKEAHPDEFPQFTSSPRVR